MEPVTPKLTASVSRDLDGPPLLSLDGELDLTTAPEAERAFRELPPAEKLRETNGRASVVVDVTNLRFMDSSGITVLLMAIHQGYELCLRRPSSIVRRLISATGLSATLPTEEA